MAGDRLVCLLFLINSMPWTLGSSNPLSDKGRPERSLRWFFERSFGDVGRISESAHFLESSPFASPLTLVSRVKRNAIPPLSKLVSSDECAEDIRKLCPKLGHDDDDLSILECLTSKVCCPNGFSPKIE